MALLALLTSMSMTWGFLKNLKSISNDFLKKQKQINHLVSFLTSTSLTPNLIGYNICVRIAIPRESSESLICLSQNCGRNRQRKFLPRIRQYLPLLPPFYPNPKVSLWYLKLSNSKKVYLRCVLMICDAVSNIDEWKVMQQSQMMLIQQIISNFK